MNRTGRRFRYQRILLWTAGGAGLCYLVLWAAVAVININGFRSTVTERLGRVIHGTVSIEALAWRLRGLHLQVTARTLAVAREDSPALSATVNRVTAEIALAPLALGRVRIRSLHLDGPMVHLAHPDTIAGGAAGAAAQPGIGTIRVTHGQLTIDPDGGKTPRRIALAIPLMTIDGLDDSGPVRFGLQVVDADTAHGGRLEITGRLAGGATPSLDLSGKASDLDPAVLAGWFPDIAGLNAVIGTAAVTARYQGDVSGYGTLSAVIDADRLRFSDPRWWPRPVDLTGAMVTVTAQIKPDQGAVTELSLSRGALRMAAAGQLDWTEGLRVRDVAIHGDFPLAEIRSLVPWRRVGLHARWLQDVMAGGGLVRVNTAVMPELPLSSGSGEWARRWQSMTVDAKAENIRIPAWPDPVWPGIQIHSAGIGVADGTVSVADLQWRIDHRAAPTISARWRPMDPAAPVTARLRGPLDLTLADWPLVADRLAAKGITGIHGSAQVDLQVTLPPAAPGRPSVAGRIGLSKAGWVGRWGAGFRFADVTGMVAISDSVIQARDMTARITPESKSHYPPVTVAAAGRIADWRDAPRLSLDRLTASAVDLRWVADQWAPGKHEFAAWLRAVFQHGGQATVTRLATRDLPLTAWSDASWRLMSGEATAAGLTVPIDSRWPDATGARARVRLADGMFAITGNGARMGAIVLDDIRVATTYLAAADVETTISADGRFHAPADHPSAMLAPVGIARIWGDAGIQVRITHAGTTTPAWRVRGRALLQGVHAREDRHGIVYADATGEIAIADAEAFQLELNTVAGRVNGAPMRTSGTLVRDNHGLKSVDLDVFADQVALSAIAERIPSLADLSVTGRLTADVRLQWQRSQSARIHWAGRVRAEGLGWSRNTGGLTIRDGRVEIAGDGETMGITEAVLTVNDQTVAATGTLNTSGIPHAELTVTAPELNLDTLAVALRPMPAPGGESEPAAATADIFLPTGTAVIHLSADAGQVRHQAFTHLAAELEYDSGTIPHWSVGAAFGTGHLRIHGTADLCPPGGRMRFTLSPFIEQLPAVTLAGLAGQQPWTLEGPISISGYLAGQTGPQWRRELTGSLSGHVDAGRITDLSATATFWNKILSVFSFKGLFTGRTFREVDKAGLLFDGMVADAVIDHGVMVVKRFRFDGSTLLITADGTIDLVSETVDATAQVVVAEALYSVLGAVPLVGKTGQQLTGVQYRITGPLAKPTVTPPRAGRASEK